MGLTTVDNKNEIILEIKNLKVGYNNTPVLHNISFSLYKGDVIALLGENGAGKTTTINSILTLLQPWEGEIFVNTTQIGFVLENSGMLSDLTVRENLLFFSKLIGGEKII